MDGGVRSRTHSATNAVPGFVPSWGERLLTRAFAKKQALETGVSAGQAGSGEVQSDRIEVALQ